MQIFREANELRTWSTKCKQRKETVALVPTMGALHDGHLSLIRLAKKHADHVVVSIFVNPTQFGPNEDLDTYPREEKEDIRKAVSAGADTFYCPSVLNMYKENHQTTVSVSTLQNVLCGKLRPGHFDGVTTVVSKLFLAASPDVAVFGQKDFQQLAIIRRMVEDLNFGINIIGAPIFRAEDGLAMSSRNRYLSTEERLQARSLYRSIQLVQESFESGERDSKKLLDRAILHLNKEPLANIEYASIQDADTLEPVSRIEKPCVFALALRFSSTRLIDNTVLTLNPLNQP